MYASQTIQVFDAVLFGLCCNFTLTFLRNVLLLFHSQAQYNLEHFQSPL
jgi:hypothetical protein